MPFSSYGLHAPGYRTPGIVRDTFRIAPSLCHSVSVTTKISIRDSPPEQTADLLTNTCTLRLLRPQDEEIDGAPTYSFLPNQKCDLQVNMDQFFASKINNQMTLLALHNLYVDSSGDSLRNLPEIKLRCMNPNHLHEMRYETVARSSDIPGYQITIQPQVNQRHTAIETFYIKETISYLGSHWSDSNDSDASSESSNGSKITG
ncbi:MAG: hypothetical protein S4CHLAM7_06780 [Chlamydiae bacterium]|nr:hypothetical protein [Chlamydiota bacterium]